MSTETLVFDDKDTLVRTAAQRFADAIRTAQAERGIALVALTGGSNGIALLRALAEQSAGIDWSKIEFFWGDDRFVPADDPERNYLQAREALLDHVAIDPARVHPMAPSDGPLGDDIDAGAQDYALALENAGNGALPAFDVHLLGMGGEGHINSLFPHTAAVAERQRPVLAVEDSPKPPPRRITLTLPVVNRSRQVWFLVSGADKAEAVAAAHRGADPGDWPCAGAHGSEATVWFLDKAAAELL